MDRRLRWYDYITVNIYWLGLTTLSQTCGLVFPLLVQSFVGEQTKGTFFGTLRLWSLMVALLMQALWGMLSDHSTARWGRRRPFILGGTLADLVFIAAIGFSAGLSGMTGYWFLLVMAILLQVSSNAAHGAEQGLIPDLVPEDRRGRFSGIKAVLEIPLPVILVGFAVGPLIAEGNMWAGLLIAMGVLTVCMLTTMLVREQPLAEAPPKLDWAPFVRLLLMTGLFTGIILGMGEIVRWIGRSMGAMGSVSTLLVVMGGLGLVAMPSPSAPECGAAFASAWDQQPNSIPRSSGGSSTAWLSSWVQPTYPVSRCTSCRVVWAMPRSRRPLPRAA